MEVVRRMKEKRIRVVEITGKEDKDYKILPFVFKIPKGASVVGVVGYSKEKGFGIVIDKKFKRFIEMLKIYELCYEKIEPLIKSPKKEK